MSWTFATHNGVDYILSQKPVYPLTEEYEQNYIASEKEGGYEQRRARFTRNRQTFSFSLQLMSDSDKSTIENLVSATALAESFTLYHPKTGAQHTVYFSSPPKFSYVNFNKWNIELTFKEV